MNLCDGIAFCKQGSINNNGSYKQTILGEDSKQIGIILIEEQLVNECNKRHMSQIPADMHPLLLVESLMCKRA